MGVKIDRKVEEVMAHYKYHFIFQEGVTDYSVDELLEQRKIARQEGDYALSDKIREKLDARDVFVFDTKDGQEVYFSLKGTTRESIINQMNEDRRANKMFDAWLYSINKSRR